MTLGSILPHVIPLFLITILGCIYSSPFTDEITEALAVKWLSKEVPDPQLFFNTELPGAVKKSSEENILVSVPSLYPFTLNYEAAKSSGKGPSTRVSHTKNCVTCKSAVLSVPPFPLTKMGFQTWEHNHTHVCIIMSLSCAMNWTQTPVLKPWSSMWMYLETGDKGLRR